MFLNQGFKIILLLVRKFKFSVIKLNLMGISQVASQILTALILAGFGSNFITPWRKASHSVKTATNAPVSQRNHSTTCFHLY